MKPEEVQSFAVKRAEVEFHNFASLGEPARAMAHYREQNLRRGALIRAHLDFTGPLTPFLEIGSNVGHTSYLLANQFDAAGFALDISADSLRHGVSLQEAWGMSRAPIRVAGDAAQLPFRDGSLRFVMAFQMLSQFMDIESVFLEVKRVLAPGGVFLLSEEPLKRLLTLGLYRCPYHDTMKPWERRLDHWGLLGFLVRDVIGAHQEESFGIRQNHTLDLKRWHLLIEKHFAAHEYDISVRATGPAARQSEWRACPPRPASRATALNRTCAARIAVGRLHATRATCCTARPAVTKPPMKAASTTCCPRPSAGNSTRATAPTSSTSACRDTPPNLARAGTSWKASSATSTAGSGRAPPRASRW
jgi:ubiquinone/menaquinone biosynthesis C-methylase UbiE